jgi:predicted acyl esterase
MEKDWKLSGFELMVADEIFRGRYWKSFEKPEPLVANQVTPFSIDLHTADHVFKKGHRIMVQVQSTWFPLIDRNPQKFVANIFMAGERDYQTAVQKVYRSRQWASHVELPVIRTGGGQ